MPLRKPEVAENRGAPDQGQGRQEYQGQGKDLFNNLEICTVIPRFWRYFGPSKIANHQFGNRQNSAT